MVPALACIKWFDCHLPGAVVSQGISRPNTENCSGFPPPTRQSASIEAELLGLTSIYSELFKKVNSYGHIRMVTSYFVGLLPDIEMNNTSSPTI